MTNESIKIMKRRFTGRMLESVLLVLAVSLGVGAAASGFSLLFQTFKYSNEILESPEYRELVFSTQDNAEDMETPLVETVKGENIILTSSDLDAAELVPQVSYSYLKSNTRMRFLSTEMINRMNGQDGGPPEGGQPQSEGNPPDSPDGDNGDFRSRQQEMLGAIEEASKDDKIIIPEVEEVRGYIITQQFFSAWNMQVEYGSLFTESDANSTSNYIVLGPKAVEMINVNDEDPADLIGKKILSMRSYYIIAGILEETGNKVYDEAFFELDKQSGNLGGMMRFMPGGNRQLRFTVSDPESLDDAAELLSGWFEAKYGEGQIVVSNPREEAENLISRNRGISYLILFLSLAGLFIASVNISNILMSRTLRMKKHVGILKALGASNKDVLCLFAGEAAVITLAGAVLGTFIALPLSNAMESAMGLDGGSWIFIATGVILSSILTFVFSVIPSFQNSGFEAAEAMRQAV